MSKTGCVAQELDDANTTDARPRGPSRAGRSIPSEERRPRDVVRPAPLGARFWSKDKLIVADPDPLR